MSRVALTLTCFTLGLALCVPAMADVRDAEVTKQTVRTSTQERPHLGLPAPHVSPRAPVVHVFFAPGATVTPVLTHAQVAQRAPAEDAAPQNAWRARAHPAQAPPVES